MGKAHSLQASDVRASAGQAVELALHPWISVTYVNIAFFSDKLKLLTILCGPMLPGSGTRRMDQSPRARCFAMLLLRDFFGHSRSGYVDLRSQTGSTLRSCCERAASSFYDTLWLSKTTEGCDQLFFPAFDAERSHVALSISQMSKRPMRKESMSLYYSACHFY